MSTLRNRVTLIGNLGQTPEVISFENGSKLAKISIATNENYTNTKGEKIESVHWHKAIAWGPQADFLEKYVDKGQEIAIEGKLITRTYETSEGSKRSKTEVQISEIQSLGARKKKEDA